MSKDSQTQTVSLDSKLTNVLVQSTIISQDTLHNLVERSNGDESVFEKLLLSEGHLIDEQLGKLKAQVHGWDFVDLKTTAISTKDLERIPRAFAETHLAVAFTDRKGRAALAIENPDDAKTIRILRKKFGIDVPVYSATKQALISEIAQFDNNLSEQVGQMVSDTKQEVSAVQLLNKILQHAVRSNASDIHLEPHKTGSQIRERIDGVLHKTAQISMPIHEQVALRVKVLANLATDEHATPQDGKFHIDDIDGKSVDVRVSTAPTTHGEKIVLRVLVASENAISLESLGMQPADLAIFEKEKSRSWGMILVTGPTGSGKTTTLYAALRSLNNDKVNISTVEDPVEYDLPGANQIQVNEKAGVGFASGLRTLVRQDPNIILVGEIRDEETANIAVNASMTGHMVLSTLHTNDAATTLPRLADMGIEPFLVASTVNLIVAQRLVRKICVRCRAGKDVHTSEMQASIPADLLQKLSQGKEIFRIYEGKGCDLCNKSGYRGRTGIFELLQVDDSIRQLIMTKADASAVMSQAVANGMTTMLDSGLQKVREGETSLEEVLRVIRS